MCESVSRLEDVSNRRPVATRDELVITHEFVNCEQTVLFGPLGE